MRSLRLLLLAASLAGAADPTVRLPKELKARPGRLLQIKADTDGKTVRWFCPSEDADLLPYPGADKTALFVSPTPGKYYLYAYTAAGDVPSEPACCVVTVEAPPPPPPPPAPPAPSDPLIQALQTAYAGDPSPDKAGQLQLYHTVLAQAATTTVSDAGIQTVGQLHDIIHQAAQTLIGNNLDALRKVIEAELNKSLPVTAGAPMDQYRDQCKKELSRIADALGRIKP